ESSSRYVAWSAGPSRSIKYGHLGVTTTSVRCRQTGGKHSSMLRARGDGSIGPEAASKAMRSAVIWRRNSGKTSSSREWSRRSSAGGQVGCRSAYRLRACSQEALMELHQTVETWV